jgi:hypothetical protein
MTPALLMLAAAAAPPGPHAAHRLSPPIRITAPSDRAPPPPAGPPPDVWVYGYFAPWAGDLTDLRWDRLTHVAIFSVDLNADGSLDQESLWSTYGPQAVELAAPHGVRVHLALTCFDDAVMESVLSNAARRADTVRRLGELVDAVGAHGVSVDCEGMPAGLRDDLVTFVGELSGRVDEVTVATPAVDWSDAYDHAALADASDALFLMGYDYHWAGGDPGPIAPLHGGDPWSRWALSWSVEDHRAAGVPDHKLVLGLPLYGRDWPTIDGTVPGTATATAVSAFMVDAVAQAERTGRLWDEPSHTPYTLPDSRSQLWYDDTDSLRDKIGWAVDQDLLGVGFWALNYEGDDPAFWQMVEEETVAPDDEPGDSGDGEDGSGGDGSGSDGSGGGDSPDAETAEPDGQEGGPPGERVPLFGCATAPIVAPSLALWIALWAAGRRRSAASAGDPVQLG